MRDSSVEHKTLAIIANPDLTTNTEALRMKNKSKVIATGARAGAISRSEGWSHYQQKWLLSMQYSLLATSLTEKQCAIVETQSNHVYLNAVEFPKSFPSEMVTAPKTAGGVGFSSLYVEHGSFDTVKTLLSHGRKDSGMMALTLMVAHKW